MGLKRTLRNTCVDFRKDFYFALEKKKRASRRSRRGWLVWPTNESTEWFWITSTNFTYKFFQSNVRSKFLSTIMITLSFTHKKYWMLILLFFVISTEAFNYLNFFSKKKNLTREIWKKLCKYSIAKLIADFIIYTKRSNIKRKERRKKEKRPLSTWSRYSSRFARC